MNLLVHHGLSSVRFIFGDINLMKEPVMFLQALNAPRFITEPLVCLIDAGDRHVLRRANVCTFSHMTIPCSYRACEQLSDGACQHI
jgi:hypothetical protein